MRTSTGTGAGAVAAFAAGAVLALLGAAAPAAAALSAKLAPMVVEASGPAERREFDLTAAANRARAEGRPLFVYLGASDCPHCRAYERFVEANADALKPHFAKYLVVELRGVSLATTQDRLFLRLGPSSLPYAEFQKSLGDERARLLVYPTTWLLDAKTFRPLMQMPAGNGTFLTVPEQIEVLELKN